MDVQLEDYVPSFDLLEALSDALLLRASGRPGPPCLIGFWNIPWLEADDTHKVLTQVVSADFCEIVVSYAVFTEDRRGALPWKALMAIAADLSREVSGLKRSPPTPEVAAVLIIYRERLEKLYFARRSLEAEVCAPSTPPSKTPRLGSPVSARRVKSYLDLFDESGYPSPIRQGADSPQTCRYKTVSLLSLKAALAAQTSGLAVLQQRTSTYSGAFSFSDREWANYQMELQQEEEDLEDALAELDKRKRRAERLPRGGGEKQKCVDKDLLCLPASAGSNGSSTGRKKYYNKRSGVNSAFKKLGLQYSGVAQWPEKKCLAELQKLGLLWKWAYTPFWRQKRGGVDVDAQGLVRAAYLVSIRVAQDSACHLMGRRPCTADVYFGLIRHALAFCQMKKNVKQQFAAGIVEWDGTRLTGTRKKEAGTKEHSGRFLVGAHRSSSSSAVFFPLPNRETKVSAPGPPETYAEVVPIIKSKMVKHKHLAASDSGTAFQKTWKEMGLQAAPARHGSAEYTPVVKLSKANLASHVLQNVTAKKRTSQTKRTVRMQSFDKQCKILVRLAKHTSQRKQLVLA
ncbi:unnamed protein product, partial [Symbiodinium sp. KB8]